MIQDKTKYEEYSKDQEIHDLKDIINSLESKIESLEKQLSISHVVGQSGQSKALQKLKDFAYEVCPLHREDDLEEIVGSL